MPSGEQKKKKRGYNSDFRNLYLILSWFMASCFLFLTGHKDGCFADDHGNSTRGTEWMREGRWGEWLREPICTWLGFNGAQDSSPGIHFFYWTILTNETQLLLEIKFMSDMCVLSLTKSSFKGNLK